MWMISIGNFRFITIVGISIFCSFSFLFFLLFVVVGAGGGVVDGVSSSAAPFSSSTPFFLPLPLPRAFDLRAFFFGDDANDESSLSVVESDFVFDISKGMPAAAAAPGGRPNGGR